MGENLSLFQPLVISPYYGDIFEAEIVDINEQNDRFFDRILARLPDEQREDGIRFFDDLVRTLTEAVPPCENCPEE